MQLIVDHNVAVADVDALGTVVAEVVEVQVTAGEGTTLTSLMPLMSQIRHTTLHHKSGKPSGHPIEHWLCK